MVRRVLLAFLVFGVTACGDSTGPEDIAGTYMLQTIHGEELPTHILGEVEVLAGSAFRERSHGGVGDNAQFVFHSSLRGALH